MRNVIAADGRVSNELSAVIELIAGDPELEEEMTLGMVRERLRAALADFAEAERVHRFGDENMLCAEIDELIDEYGEEALALDLAVAKASEDLSILIEALLDDTDEETALTLGGVREAMADGLVASLVGEGLLEPEDEQALMAEIDGFIVRLGEDEPAESVLRFD